jgi:hypothetical protein
MQTPDLARKPSPCIQKDWRIKDLHRLHRSQQALPEGSLPSASHRLGRGLHGRQHSCASLTATLGIVTTPSEIILYYHLNHSIWSLSDNKESSR